MKLLNLRKVPKEKLISIMKCNTTTNGLWHSFEKRDKLVNRFCFFFLDYAANLGDDDIEEDRIDEEKAYIQKLIEKF